MILDASVREQTYIEDCEVCCNPIELTAAFEENELIRFDSESIEQ
ncbi:MAG: CPXCG motif-containing cysteine-rich protein [Polaribacter sp.]|nr:CPXCG motif-containing cysteine-rich protein [Polaribacter sp.]